MRLRKEVSLIAGNREGSQTKNKRKSAEGWPNHPERMDFDYAIESQICRRLRRNA